jgi:hypothetical protein
MSSFITVPRIEIQLDDLNQLFNAREDTPFHGKGLNQDAEEFIESTAENFPRDAPVSLVVSLAGKPPAPDAQPRLEKAMRSHFANAARLNKLAFSRLMADGRRTMLVGLTFLAFCLLMAARVFPEDKSGVINTMFHESFIIAGWVALWRPLEICLYDWWPIRKRGHLLQRLAAMAVEVRSA